MSWQTESEIEEMQLYHERTPIQGGIEKRANNCIDLPRVADDTAVCDLWKNCTTEALLATYVFHPYEGEEPRAVYSRLITFNRETVTEIEAWEMCRIDLRTELEKCYDDNVCRSYMIIVAVTILLILMILIGICQVFSLCCFNKKKKKFKLKEYKKKFVAEKERVGNIQQWRESLQEVMNGIDPVILRLSTDEGSWQRRPGDPVVKKKTNKGLKSTEGEISSDDEVPLPVWKKRQKIEANCQREGEYWKGVIIKVHGGGFYDIKYEDNEIEEGVAAIDIRRRGHTKKLEKETKDAEIKEASQFESAEDLKIRMNKRLETLKAVLPVKDGKLTVRADIDLKPWEYHRDYFNGGYTTRNLEDCFKFFHLFGKEIEASFHGREFDFDKAEKENPGKRNKRFKTFDYSTTFVMSLKTHTDFSKVTKVNHNKFVKMKKDEWAEEEKKKIREKETAMRKLRRKKEKDRKRAEKEKRKKNGELVESSDNDNPSDFEEELASTRKKRQTQSTIAKKRKAKEDAAKDKFNQRGLKNDILDFEEEEISSDEEAEERRLKAIRPKEIRTKDFDEHGGRGELLCAFIIKEHYMPSPTIDMNGKETGDLIYEVIFAATPEKYQGFGFGASLFKMLQRFVYARGGRAIVMCPPPRAFAWAISQPSMNFSSTHTMPIELQQKYIMNEYVGLPGYRCRHVVSKVGLKAHRNQCGVGLPPKEGTKTEMKDFENMRPSRAMIKRLEYVTEEQRCGPPFYMRSGRREKKWKKSGQPKEGYKGVYWTSRPATKAPYSKYYRSGLFFSGKPFRMSTTESTHVWWIIPSWEEIDEEFEHHAELARLKERQADVASFEAALTARTKREADLRAKKAARAGVIKPKTDKNDGKKGGKVHPILNTAMEKKKAAYLQKMENRKRQKAVKQMKAAAIVAKRLQNRQKAAEDNIKANKDADEKRQRSKKYQLHQNKNTDREAIFKKEKDDRENHKRKGRMKSTPTKNKDNYISKLKMTLKQTETARVKDKTYKWSRQR